jgi:hypothetical protein
MVLRVSERRRRLRGNKKARSVKVTSPFCLRSRCGSDGGRILLFHLWVIPYAGYLMHPVVIKKMKSSRCMRNLCVPEASFTRAYGGLHTVGHLQFAEDVGDMITDGFHANREFSSDVTICVPLRD